MRIKEKSLNNVTSICERIVQEGDQGKGGLFPTKEGKMGSVLYGESKE